MRAEGEVLGACDVDVRGADVGVSGRGARCGMAEGVGRRRKLDGDAGIGQPRCGDAKALRMIRMCRDGGCCVVSWCRWLFAVPGSPQRAGWWWRGGLGWVQVVAGSSCRSKVAGRRLQVGSRALRAAAGWNPAQSQKQYRAWELRARLGGFYEQGQSTRRVGNNAHCVATGARRRLAGLLASKLAR